MKKLRILSILMAVIVLGGCTHLRPRSPSPLTVYNKQINKNLSSNWLAQYDAMPEATPAEQATKAAQRNHLLRQFVSSVDHNYYNFETSYYSNKAIEDISGDFIGIALGGATVFTESAHAKTILATVAAAIVGGKASVDAHWYDSRTREAIVMQMHALRDTQLTVIETGMGGSLASYPLDQGILDVQEYYQAGSISSALQAISQTANSNAVTARAARRQIRK